MPHRASRSDLTRDEWQDLEDAPFEVQTAHSRVADRIASDVVRAALMEHLRQTQELALRLERALGALEPQSRKRIMTA